MGSPPGAPSSTREDLIRAGLELADALPLEKLYAGVTTAATAERAGVTTGSFFHHFRSAEQFADAIVRSYIHERPLNDEVVEELLDALEHADLADAITMTLLDTWQLMSRDPGMAAELRGQMHLFAHNGVPLVHPSDELTDEITVVGDVLRSVFRVQIDAATDGWQRLLESSDIRVLEPFDPRRLSVAVHALLIGLLVSHAVDPSAVDDQLFADTAATLAGAVTHTELRPPRIVLAAEFVPEADVSPQARSGARRRQESRQRVVDATTGMFEGGWDSVSATEVAEAAGVSTQTVINLFGNVRKVCAATFGAHLPAIEGAIDAAGPDRPMDALREGLLALARAAADDPHPARALLTERLGIRAARDFDLDDDDIRVLVPIGIRLTFVVAELLGTETTEPGTPDLTATLVDFVLGHAVPRPRRAEETVDLALRLLPAQALL
ncbi:TetR/AcrR family transcriptional regulator [Dermatobacter hominis]|uniref:TetR/AcrR family transcriptional regulator n=1 Tax=Dermatobacter hominis TaxID=2884263 RepID=UPI001D11C786|nr:TetR/AcrR family transcriptional regulator [Dermatobacter hominis]UDY34745.1 TetR/AcrR family transcriptional regulator [Dermatobacter hominis]